jgi:hypothetical protein
MPGRQTLGRFSAYRRLSVEELGPGTSLRLVADRIDEWKKRHAKKLKGLDVTKMLRQSRAER